MKTMKKIKWFVLMTVALFVTDCYYEIFIKGIYTAKSILGLGFGGMGLFGYIWYSIGCWFSK